MASAQAVRDVAVQADAGSREPDGAQSSLRAATHVATSP